METSKGKIAPKWMQENGALLLKWKGKEPFRNPFLARLVYRTLNAGTGRPALLFRRQLALSDAACVGDEGRSEAMKGDETSAPKDCNGITGRS